MKMVDKIIVLLEAKGWDQGELESRAGLAHGRISKWKADKGEPTARQALVMARLLGVPMEYLADDELVEPPPVPAPALTLADDERAILDLYRDLELSRQEGVKRLATPLVTYTGQPWLPGAVRDLTAGVTPKPPRRPRKVREDNIVAHDEGPDEPPPKGKGKRA